MADTSNLSNYLKDVADAIRDKKGTEEQIPAANFDTEIRNIQTGIDTSDATAISDDIINPKTAYVNGKKIEGTLTDYNAGLNTGVESITPNVGYDGSYIEFKAPEQDGPFAFSSDKVSLIMTPQMSQVAEGIGLTPEKLVKGNTILGVEGAVEPGVKVFATMEEMQADEHALEGDVAVVYGQSYENLDGSSQPTSLYFNETVVLSEAWTERKSERFTGIQGDDMLDGNAYLTPTLFEFRVMGGGSTQFECSVDYTSTDGITYTRTNIEGGTETDPNRIDLPIPMFWMQGSELWDPVFGEFIKIPVMFFGGIFNYIKNASDTLEWVFAPNQFTATDEWVYKKNFFGPNGAGTGTLFENVSGSLNDSNASACNDMIAAYSQMEPIMVTDEDITGYKYRFVNSIPIKYDGTPVLDTSNVTNMTNFLNQNRIIKYIPKLNTSNVTNMSQAFNINPELLYVADNMDMSSCTNLGSTLSNCVQLKTAPIFLNTNKVTSFDSMFREDTELVNLPIYNTNACTSMRFMVSNCPKLSNESLNNIMQMCINAVSYTATKTLKDIGLSEEQATTCTTLSNYTAFIEAGWITGY